MKILNFVLFICIASALGKTPWLNENVPTSGLVEGDIALEDAPDTEQRTTSNNPHPHQHGVDSDTSIKTWEDRTIPFIMDANFNLRQRATILLAMAEIEDKTCLKFVSRDKHTDYILFKYHQTHCSSLVGRFGQRQHINLTEECIQKPDSVKHELMHALGFHHEHSRHDRDRYITVNLAKVGQVYHSRFDKRREDPIDSKYPYDYRSVMHYPVNAHAIYKNSITIQSKFDWGLIKSNGLSHIDVSKINFIYKCSNLEQNVEDVEDSIENVETTTRNVPIVHRAPVSQPMQRRVSTVLTTIFPMITSTSRKSNRSEEETKRLNRQLFDAIKNGHFENVIQLVNDGADLNARDEVQSWSDRGGTAVNTAAWLGHVNIVAFLLSRSANVHLTDRKGKSTLYHAIENGHADVVQVLLSNFANIEEKRDGSTPLYFASFAGKRAVVLTLLENGANVNAENTNGETPLHTAAEHGYVDIVQMLLNYSANIEAKSNGGSTPLHFASSTGKKSVVLVLLEKGANIFAHDNNDRTPLDVAKKEIREILERKQRELSSS